MKPSHIAVMGVPMDLGSGRRGVDMGPSALRVAHLNGRLKDLGYIVDDLGNVSVVQPETEPAGNTNAKYLAQITSACQQVAEMVVECMRDGKFPMVLGGDHSIAIGTVAGVSKHFHDRSETVGLLWIDAHADMNTPESSPSGNVHGMPLACCAGFGPRDLTHLYGFAPKVNPHNTVMVGIRSVDELEREVVRKSGVRAFTMRDIDERGMQSVMQEAVRIASAGTAGFHVSLDLDAVDPQEAPGVGTPVKGGITYREAHLAMELLCDCGSVTSLEVVEVNPVIDEANRTALLAVELMMSAMGKRIL